MIDMSKKYTSHGDEMRVLCVDSNRHGLPVVAMCVRSGIAMCFTERGHCISDATYNLIEVSPYADFKIDEPVMVRDDANDRWVPQHFAGVDTEGLATTWAGGGTSWSKDPEDFCLSWQECRRPTAEELASCAG